MRAGGGESGGRVASSSFGGGPGGGGGSGGNGVVKSVIVGFGGIGGGGGKGEDAGIMMTSPASRPALGIGGGVEGGQLKKHPLIQTSMMMQHYWMKLPVGVS